MGQQEQITEFLNRYVIGLPRCYGPLRYSSAGHLWDQPRPSAEVVAKEFLALVDFRALQLGTWLGTADGEIVTHAVELAVPMFYAEDVALLIEALKLAAATQQQEGRQKALANAAVSLLAIGFGYAASRGKAA